MGVQERETQRAIKGHQEVITELEYASRGLEKQGRYCGRT